ncbi:MAG: response regulator [Candidatus Rokubacteria bacterium]|nr:response regulator [Candidatus Rokubacteria bacterium]
MRAAQILVVDDNADDRRFASEALAAGALRSEVSTAEDGDEALALLRREGRYATAPRPDLILLDLHMPGKSGFDVLAEIRRDPGLRAIPVIVLSGSTDAGDVRSSYDGCASSYIAKPADLDAYDAVVAAIEQFWLTTASLPGPAP